MALIEVSDIEAALGREPDDSEEEAQWQFYIDSLSDFLNNYVDVSFEFLEDVTVRYKADYYGQVTLKGPVRKVTSVLNFRTQEEDQWVDWDGFETLYYLEANQVVDVLYSYGYDDVPTDIKNLMISGVLAQIGEQSPVNLRAHKVGDVEDQYRDNNVAQLFGTTAAITLAKYSNSHFTINTAGADHFPDYLERGYSNDFD